MNKGKKGLEGGESKFLPSYSKLSQKKELRISVGGKWGQCGIFRGSSRTEIPAWIRVGNSWCGSDAERWGIAKDRILPRFPEGKSSPERIQWLFQQPGRIFRDTESPSKAWNFSPGAFAAPSWRNVGFWGCFPGFWEMPQ